MSKIKSMATIEPVPKVDAQGWHLIEAGVDDYLLKIMRGRCCEHCGDSKDLSFKILDKVLTIRCALCHCEHVFPIEIFDT